MATPNPQQGNEGTSPTTADQQEGNQATQTRRSGQDEEHSRSIENVPSEQTVPEQVYADYAQNYDEEDDAALNGRIPDVLLDAPVVSIKGLDFELDDLRAKVSLFAKVLDLVELSVGIDAYLGKVKLTIESVDVQALLKVRLDNVTAIIDRVLTTIDRNPQIVQEIASGVGSAVQDVGEGAGELVGEGANEAVSDVGSATGSAVGDVGRGAGKAVEDVGGGAGQAAGELGQGAGQAAQEVGGGAGQTAKQVGNSVGQTAQGATDAAGEAAGQAGDATEQVPEGAQEEEDSGRSAEGTAASGAQVLSETTDEAGRTVRRVADDSGSIVEQTLDESGQVSEEEAVVDEADTAVEVGEQKTEVNATPAAERRAEDLGVDLSQIEGTGSGGRITARDVIGAANQG
jgi:pyruvate/2-oxoglutarate dehydrogenase complex dihydrolipoamide acyltransferase (E2) component